MCGSERVKAGSLHRAIGIPILAAALIFCPTLPLRAGDPASKDGSPTRSPAVLRVALSANEMADQGSSRAGATIVSQVHNAPGWQPSHRYTYATGPYTRVVNGP